MPDDAPLPDMDPPVAVDTVLVAVDGSDESARAGEYAVAIASKYDARVHALYVFDERTVRAIEGGLVDQADIAAETQVFIETIRELAADRDVPLADSTAYGFSTTSKLRHPGSAILDTADQVAADFLVIPRESFRDAPGGVLEKAAEYVLLYASQPVLSV